jgi:hypothetical protein
MIAYCAQIIMKRLGANDVWHIKRNNFVSFQKLFIEVVPIGFEPAIRIFVQAQFGDLSI